MKKKILICGEKGVGKSTLIRCLLDAADLRQGGFYTKKEFCANQPLHPVYIYSSDLPEARRSRGAENLVGRCDESGCREIYPAVFNTLGVSCLENTTGKQVIVMDELGFMESSSYAFCQAVLKALDGDIPVLAAVKAGCDVEFLLKVRSHPQAEVVQITPENREELYHLLLPVVRGWKVQSTM